MSSLPTRSMTRTLADTVASRVSAAGLSFPDWNGRRILLANLVVLAVVACFALLFRFAAALFILFVGVSLGMAVKPGVEGLRRHGIRRWAGALAIYAVLGCLCTGVLMLAVPVIADQTATLVARAPHHFERLRGELLSSESNTLRRIAWYLPAAAERSGTPALDVKAVLETGGAIGRNLFTVVAVLLLGFYWTLEGERRMRALVLFAPFDRRRAIRGFLSEVERTVGAYLRGQSLVCLVIGLLAFVIYRVIGAAPRRHRRPRLCHRRGDPRRGSDRRNGLRGDGRGIGRAIVGLRRGGGRDLPAAVRELRARPARDGADGRHKSAGHAARHHRVRLGAGHRGGDPGDSTRRHRAASAVALPARAPKRSTASRRPAAGT